MEVIDLSDDEDIIIEEAPKKEKGSKRPFRCLNTDCRTEKGLVVASEQVRRYFGVLSYPKKKRVCPTCFCEFERYQDKLINVLESKNLLLAEKLPLPKMSIILTDSDSDTSDGGQAEDSEYEIECDDGKDLQETLESIFSDLGLNDQLLKGAKHLEEKSERLIESFEKLHNEDYATIEKELDMVRKEFYDSFQNEIVWQPSLDIGPSGNVTQQSDGTDVIAEEAVLGPREKLPPFGPLERHELKPEEVCFAMKYSLFARWVQAQVLEVDRREPNNKVYKIRYNRFTKSGGLPRLIPGRQLAYSEVCLTRIPVGTRIIAKYKDEDPKNLTISGSFYVGIVAEIPTAANKYRYLIFFDDGYAQYVFHEDIRVVTEASSASPWDDVSSDSREFIKEYLQMYPERPMVRLQKGNFVKTEWNGRWWRAQVQEVDGSLVQMFFPVDGRTEWIYRGSTRLSPLFNKKLNIKAQTEQVRTIRRRTAPIPGSAVVEYGTFGQGQDGESGGSQPGERRAVARKSTMTRAGTPPKEIMEKVKKEAQGYINNHPLEEKIMKFRKHICSIRCLGRGDSMDKFKDFSPLLSPLLQGWNRIIAKPRRNGPIKPEVFYVSPCGIRLRNIEEVFRYTVNTESSLEIDCFSFEVGVNVCLEWEPFKRIYYLEDLTKGEENVKISCVNALDGTEPLPLNYCNVRLPTEHVPLNLDQDFLVCCDCTDNCQNKDKCACQQMTIRGAQALNLNRSSTAGYEYRRLYEQVMSGIYECNSRCNCAVNRCMNRVVQHPLRLKLQLFKTARRGWGVRTLADVPRGGFICVYVGKMLSENVANEEGKQIIGGDDYYAELDYIEVMESFKEGYEEEVVDPEGDGLPIHQKSTASRSGSSDEDKRSRKRNSKDGSDSNDDDDDDDDVSDEKQRQRQTFLPKELMDSLSKSPDKRKSVREYFGEDESVYIMDAKTTGNIGRYLNHSCEPNSFVQNVFVDTHDLRFPWVSFFAIRNIRAGTELTWDYNYEVDSVPGKMKYCYCGAKKCRGRLL